MFKTIALLVLAPIASLWVIYQERRIRKSGEALTPEQLAWAKQIGIQQAEKIRIIQELELKFPCPGFLTAILAKKGFSINQAAGMSLRYGIFISDTITPSPRLICHELTHTLQYERLGGIFQFLYQYIYECLYFGYHNAPMEHEADRCAEQCLTALKKH